MYIIAFFISVLLIWHFSSKHELKTQVAKQGGMKNKYKELVDVIMSINPDFKITNVTSDSITIGYSTAVGAEQFTLKQQIREINIIWELYTVIYGKHILDWNFHEFENTEIIFERILNDLSKYQKNLTNRR
jgi:hypothetical protein